MIRLDNRLELCSRFVRCGSRVADIGTDHAYLPAYLCQRGTCPSAVAADINPAPLKSGGLTVANEGLTDKIELRLSDGLAEIGEDEADDVVIAGMGGELILRIITAWNYSKNENKRFILQPMTRSEELIAGLDRGGFEIIGQDCCEAAGKCYTVICAGYSGKAPCGDPLFPYLGKLKPRENPLHARFVRNHIARLEKKAIGEPAFGELAARLRNQIE